MIGKRTAAVVASAAVLGAGGSAGVFETTGGAANPPNLVPRSVIPSVHCGSFFVCGFTYKILCTGYHGAGPGQLRHVDFGRCWWTYPHGWTVKK